jgi:hypothetical protein
MRVEYQIEISSRSLGRDAVFYADYFSHNPAGVHGRTLRWDGPRGPRMTEQNALSEFGQIKRTGKVTIPVKSEFRDAVSLVDLAYREAEHLASGRGFYLQMTLSIHKHDEKLLFAYSFAVILLPSGGAIIVVGRFSLFNVKVVLLFPFANGRLVNFEGNQFEEERPGEEQFFPGP